MREARASWAWAHPGQRTGLPQANSCPARRVCTQWTLGLGAAEAPASASQVPLLLSVRTPCPCVPRGHAQYAPG